MKFSKSDLAPALQRLANQGLIEWPEADRAAATVRGLARSPIEEE